MLLLWQPRAPTTPTPPPDEEVKAVPGDIGGGGDYSQRVWHDVRRRRDEQDEEELLQLIALAVPLLERR